MIETIRNYARRIVYVGLYITFALVPVSLRMHYASAPFSADYVLGYFITIPVGVTIIAWLVAGRPGWQALKLDKLRLAWVVLLLVFLGWVAFSNSWAYMRDIRPELAVAATLRWTLVFLFVLVLMAVRPPAKWLVMVLIGSMLVNGAIAGLQTAQQGSIGLSFIGEKDLDPQVSGVSVIQSGETRWLRPYALADHSNIFAGFMAATVLMTAVWMTSAQGRVRWLGTGIFLFGLWILFLSFSRGAWIGFVAGAVVLLPLLLRKRLRSAAIRWHVGVTLILTLLAGGVFFVLYQPLLLTRAGISNEGGTIESTEARAINERIIYENVARAAIDRSPIIGIGAGNFPWYASYYLFYETELQMRGDNVHQVYLYIHAELGVIGYGLFVALVVLGVEIALRKPITSDAVYRYGLLAGFVALAVIGLVDHYPWTIFHFQMFWWGMLAASGNTTFGQSMAEKPNGAILLEDQTPI